MTQRAVRVPGDLSVVDAWGGGATVAPFIVGSPPQWNDGSDGTYADLETFEHPDVSYADTAIGTLERGVATSQNVAKVTVKARIRYQSLAVDMKPPTVLVYYSGATGSLLNGAAPDGTLGALNPTWIDITLNESQGGRMQTFLSRVNDTVGTLDLRVVAPTLRTYSFRYPRTRVYEAYLIVQTPSNDAPPCRIFPRRDGLGVGAGVAYPPPRSQQRSPGRRGVGYY